MSAVEAGTFLDSGTGVAEPFDLRVMSYNVLGQAHALTGSYLRWVSRAIQREGPDVVGLQEVHRGTWMARFADQIDELARLTGMTAHFEASLAGEGRDGRRWEVGNAVLTRGAIRSGSVVTLPGSGEPRTLLDAEVEVRGFGLRFFVTHLSAWGRLTSPSRHLQVQRVAERLHGCGEPFVLVGDLNAPPEAPELRHLMAADLYRMCGDALESTHRMTRQRLDYVFADAGWQIVSERIPRGGPSDHYPVVVDLRRAAAG
ncbi:MAG TPA: endonuclease/exonuclease/phosphatase family protein [Thermoanaerobaculia bacterium]|nr:endonuclease/exonuclease/phosphatase family protein [Thermoanaerobaculia bacterium]